MCVIFIPSLDVECQRRYSGLALTRHRRACIKILTSEEREDCLPALSEIHRGGKEQNLESRVDRVDAMVEQLSKRTTLVGSSGLASIDGVKCLVEKQTNRPTKVHPRWAVLIQCRRVP